MKICHITSVHPRFDTRVFYRECKSLLSAGYDVSLVVADGGGYEVLDGINVYDVGRPKNRTNRILGSTFKVFFKAKSLNAKVYHFHDPELFVIGLLLKACGKSVIFDVHEDIYEQISMKNYLPFGLKPILKTIAKFMNYISRFAFELVLAESSYRKSYGNRGVVVLNTPDIDFFDNYYVADRSKLKSNELFYIGGVSKARGLDTILDSLVLLKERKINFFMHFIGPVIDKVDIEKEYPQIIDHIKFYGKMKLSDGYEISKKSKIGLAILKPEKNYINSYPTKIFEYMAIGMPVITSNFKLYSDVVEKNEVGVCVNPLDPIEISRVIENILTSQQTQDVFSKNGRKTIVEDYNWLNEKNKLIKLYSMINKGK